MSHNCSRVQDRKVVKGSESAKKADVEKAAVVTECAGQASAVAEHEVNSTSSNIFHWNANTGATSHMTPHKNWIRNYRLYRVSVKLADHRIIYSEGVGSVLFRPVKNGKQYRDVEFTRVLHVPALRNNLLSVLYLTKYKGIDAAIIYANNCITRKVLMRRFRNNKPYYVIFTLSRDISEILLKCPKCYITILTEPEFELPALELPLRQFEDLHVDSNAASKSGKEVLEGLPSNVPADVEMENVEYYAHQISTDASTTLQDNEEDICAHHSTSLPPIDTISNAPPVNEDDKLDQREETPEDAQNLMPPSPYFNPNVWKELDLAHLTQNQCNSAHQMRLVLSRLQAHMLLLTSVHFGSHSSHRSFHRLHEAIPQSALQQFFQIMKPMLT